MPALVIGSTKDRLLPFGHLVRPTDSTERPGQSWVDLAGTIDGRAVGLTVVNDAKYAYDVTGSDLGITAARSPVYAWHDPKHLDADGIYTYQDQGPQHFTHLLLPHAGSWRQAEVNRRDGFGTGDEMLRRVGMTLLPTLEPRQRRLLVG